MKMIEGVRVLPACCGSPPPSPRCPVITLPAPPGVPTPHTPPAAVPPMPLIPPAHVISWLKPRPRSTSVLPLLRLSLRAARSGHEVVAPAALLVPPAIAIAAAVAATRIPAAAAGPRSITRAAHLSARIRPRLWRPGLRRPWLRHRLRRVARLRDLVAAGMQCARGGLDDDSAPRAAMRRMLRLLRRMLRLLRSILHRKRHRRHRRRHGMHLLTHLRRRSGLGHAVL